MEGPVSLLLGIIDVSTMERICDYIAGEDSVNILERLFSSPSAGIETSSADRSRLGVACILAFVQANWTGPPLPEAFPDLRRTECLERLQVDGESAYPLTKCPWLLVLALNLLRDTSGPCRWFYFRAVWLHARLLDNLVPSLAATMESIVSACVDEIASAYGGECYVEAALALQHCNKQHAAETLLEKAAVACGFRHHLTGVLGRRTKFQDFDVAQLTVRYETAPESRSASLAPAAAYDPVPKSIELQDEYILDRPVLDDISSEDISSPAKAILLGDCMHVLRFYAKDNTVVERSSALVQKVLDRPGEWSIYSSALFLRSMLESQRPRMIERAALQYQALVDQIGAMDVAFPTRASYLFSSPLPPEWELDRCQGKLFARLGAFRTASEIFERRHMWDEHVACLVQLGERQKAEELLTRIIAQEPGNHQMICILGDLWEDPALYERAWETSNHRCARAMRSLGMHHIRKDNLSEAIVAFERALALNGLFDKIWFLLGCAAMQLEEWKKALNAFSRVIALESDNADAWNNLAAVHLHLGSGEEALRCLKEAGKRQYESWKIWDNIFRVAMSLGEFMEAIAAYRRVCEIREKEASLEGLHMILETLRTTLQQRSLDDPFVVAVIRQINSLLDGVMASHLSMRSEFWLACASYTTIIDKPGETLEFYFKAYRALQSEPVEHDLSALGRVLDCVRRIRETLATVRASSSAESSDVDERTFQLKTIVENLLLKTRQNHRDTAEFRELSSWT